MPARGCSRGTVKSGVCRKNECSLQSKSPNGTVPLLQAYAETEGSAAVTAGTDMAGDILRNIYIVCSSTSKTESRCDGQFVLP